MPCAAGQVFRLDHAAADVERLYATGLFEYVDVLPRVSTLEGTEVRTPCLRMRERERERRDLLAGLHGDLQVTVQQL